MAAVPWKPPTLEELFERLTGDAEIFMWTITRITQAGLGTEPAGKYRHWNKLRYLKPPGDLSHEEWWYGVKLARHALYRQLPFVDKVGRPFVYAMPDGALACLHYIDQHASGEIAVSEVVMQDASSRQRYLVNSLIEEAIRSSQLEGASTTRPVAKEMIRSGRPARDRSELMILNNYRALQFIREDAGDELSPEIVLELHRILTEGTLDNPDAAGRLQTSGEERIAVRDRLSDEIIHEPPPADELVNRLQRLCDFANEEVGATGFMHPVVRSVLLHFILGYDHPFEDGNGRTARALFYWGMRKHGYWLTEYLSISRIFRQAPAQYRRAFLDTETDENDTTYFVVYNLQVIKRAIGDMRDYLERKMREVREVEQLLRKSDEFNHRQLSLLGNALRNPLQRYTFRSHAMSHNVTRQSARTDLLGLVQKGLFQHHRSGREFVFQPVSDLPNRLSGPDEPVTEVSRQS